MPSVRSHRITRGDAQYELDLGFNDSAIMEERVEFEITARSRRSDKTEWEEHTATVSFELGDGRALAIVNIEGHGSFEVDLSEIDISPYTPFEDAWEMIKNACEGDAIEQAILAIPGDPVIGCLIKAGVSTSIGQTMSCYREAEYAKSTRMRIKRTIECLGDNLLSMVFTATARTLKCMVMLGF